MESSQMSWGDWAAIVTGLVVGVCLLLSIVLPKKKPSVVSPPKEHKDWAKEYNRYFWKGGKGLVFYPAPTGEMEVLRIPLDNPYEPYSDEWARESGLFEDEGDQRSYNAPYLEWMVQHKWALEKIAERDRVRQLRIDAREKVEKRIRVQHRRVSRC